MTLPLLASINMDAWRAWFVPEINNRVTDNTISREVFMLDIDGVK
jgi:hypothetical protein